LLEALEADADIGDQFEKFVPMELAVTTDLLLLNGQAESVAKLLLCRNTHIADNAHELIPLVFGCEARIDALIDGR